MLSMLKMENEVQREPVTLESHMVPDPGDHHGVIGLDLSLCELIH